MSKTHLIIVPCHSIWKADEDDEQENFGQNPEHWLLAPFQYEGNDHLSFMMHSFLAIEKLVQNLANSVLLYSGSRTKLAAKDLSEARSYYMLSQKLLRAIECGDTLPEALSKHKHLMQVCTNILQILSQKRLSVEALFDLSVEVEEFALDSFDNLLYSIAKFNEMTGLYPSELTIVGFGFKQSRFIDYHAAAIDFPSQSINYISFEPQPSYVEAERLLQYYTGLAAQEKKNALDLFKDDWYGTRAVLANKKLSRNPFGLIASYNLPFELESPIESDEQFFQKNVCGIMPWSPRIL
ncbi:LAMI_0F04720g1_1 [Lachancea mirantina]|uniref:LAMI_0F04720g1_1 n=1 Tax=Lachancea mirantina TaxID=1230905 RepID=A0A1G4JXW1_9SACH|nr:LAMI_0F04720g1_1 [Lachancea mirantina]